MPASACPLLSGAVLLATLGSVGATLPADNGGTPFTAAGDLAPQGRVVCSNATGQGNYTFSIAPELDGAALIIFALNPHDLFTQNMANDPGSLDRFLQSDAVGAGAVGSTSYLFLAYARAGCYGGCNAEAEAITAAFRDRLVARASATKLGPGVLTRMHFAAEAVEGVPGLSQWLAQWTTPVTSLVVELGCELGICNELNISRLDGKYEQCPWPSEDGKLASIVDGGDGCTPLDKAKVAGKTAVVTSLGCSQEDAAKNGEVADAVIVIAAPGTLPSELTKCGSGSGVAAVVSHEDGAKLLAALTASAQKELNGTFSSIRMPGAFAAIDSAGRAQELGWEKYSTLEMLSWSAQYFDYRAELTANVSKPHYSIPITGWRHGMANVTLPDAAILRMFSTMEVENALTCDDSEGRMDQSCPAWDHNIALGVVCATNHDDAAVQLKAQLASGPVSLGEPGGYPGELARYITPFRRQLGQWITPATAQMPLLTDPTRRSCTFSVEQSAGWVNDFKLRFSGSAGADGPPPVALTNLFNGGGFSATYNDNRTILIEPPPGLGAAANAELSFILSGHGDMEFDASTHVFHVNGDAYSWTSEGVAGTELGCAIDIRAGRVQPNEHGTWYTGRNGWCNGADVPVRRHDVTVSVAKASPVNVTYHAVGPGGEPPGKQGGGNIVLSSVLAWRPRV